MGTCDKYPPHQYVLHPLPVKGSTAYTEGMHVYENQMYDASVSI